MATEVDPNEQNQAQLTTGEIDEGLERDLREVMGWNDSSQESEPQNDDPNNNGENSSSPENNQQTPENEGQQQEPTVEIDGEQVPISQVRSWRKGHLMLDDYTRKTQQLADERRRLEQEQQRLQPLAYVEQLLNQNPQIAEAMKRVLRDQFGVNVPATNPYGGQTHSHQAPYPAQSPGYRPQASNVPPAYSPPTSVGQQPLQAMPGAMGVDPVFEQRFAKIEESVYDQMLDRSLNNVRAQADAERQKLGLQPLNDQEWGEVSNQLMTEAYTTRQGIEQVWQASPLRSQWAYDAVEAARKAAEEQQRQAQNRRAGAVMNGTMRGAPEAPRQNTVPKDFGQATQAAYAELRQSGVSLLSSDD